MVRLRADSNNATLTCSLERHVMKEDSSLRVMLTGTCASFAGNFRIDMDVAGWRGKCCSKIC